MTGARRPKLADRALLARWHHDEGVTLTEIARRVGCTVSAVSQAMRRHGLEICPHVPPPPVELADEAWLRDQYVDQGRSIDTIARLLAAGFLLATAGVASAAGPPTKCVSVNGDLKVELGTTTRGCLTHIPLSENEAATNAGPPGLPLVEEPPVRRHIEHRVGFGPLAWRVNAGVDEGDPHPFVADVQRRRGLREPGHRNRRRRIR